MSRENVEIVRRIYEAVARRDSETVLSYYDPRVEWDHTYGPVRELMGGPAVYHGHEGIREWSREWYEAWENIEADVEELVDAGDQVIGVLTYRGRGRQSGVEVEIPGMAGVWTIQDGKVVRVRWFRTRDEAFAAAGAPERPAQPQNVEVARRVLGAVAALDLERLRELTAPDVEWRSFFAAMSGAGEYQGHEGLAEYIEDLREPWDLLRPEPEEVLTVGDIVLIVGRMHYRGKESGAEEEVPAGWLFHIRDGKVTRFDVFKDPERALAELGGEQRT